VKIIRQKLIESNANLTLIVFSAFLLLYPIFFRDKGFLLGGITSYYNLNNGLLSYIASINPYIVATYLPLIFGIISLILFYKILSFLDKNIAFASSIIIAISPGFINLYHYYNSYFIPITLSLLTFYLILKTQKDNWIYLIYLIAIFSDIYLTMILVLIATIYISKWKTLFLIPSIGISGFISGLSLRTGSFSLLYELGTKEGLSIFILFLAFFGIREMLKKKYSYASYFLIFFVSLVGLIFSRDLIILFLFIVTPVATKGLDRLWTHNWKNLMIGRLVLFISVIGLLFSTVMVIGNLIDELPDDMMIDGFMNLKDLDDGVVFAAPNRGIWIKTISEKEHYFNEELAYTRDFEIAKKIINETKIKYVWIDSYGMNDYWYNDEDGFMFIIKYNQDFDNIYNNGVVSIWEFNE